MFLHTEKGKKTQTLKISRNFVELYELILKMYTVESFR